MSKKKKVTAPLSYDPGKGRPKEYLAYLNWQEMQALQRLNGGNMEIGPKGLPSFPPADSRDETKTPGTGNWTGAPGSGTTSSGVGAGTGGGSESGNIGGTSASPSTTASAAGDQQASSDTNAQQEAAERDAANAARSSAFAEDARKAGIGSINIGPMQNPVKIGGGQIFGSMSGMAQQVTRPTAVVSTTTPSGVPVGGANYYHRMTESIPGMTSPEKFSTKITPSSLMTEYGVPAETWSNAYNANKLTPGAQKIHQAIVDESLRTMTPVNFFSGLRGGGSPQHTRGQAIDIKINDPVTGKPVGYESIGNLANNPIASVRSGYRTPAQAARIEAALEGPYRDFATGVIGSFYSNPGVYGDFKNQRWGGSFQTGEFAKDYMHFDEGKAMSGVSADQALLRTEAAYRAQNAPSYSSGALASFGGAYSPTSNYASAASVQPTSGTTAASIPSSSVSGISALAGKPYQDRLVTLDGETQEFGPESFAGMSPEKLAEIDAYQQAQIYDSNFMGPLGGTQVAEAEIENVEEQYRRPEGVAASVIPSKYNYPVKPDGTPYTAEDIANLPPDIQKAHYEALMAERMGRVPYNLTEAQRNKIAVAKGVGRVVNYNPLTRAFVTGSRVLGGGLGMLPGAAGEFGEGLADAAGQIRDPGAAVEAYETASPLQQVQMEVLAGKPNYIPGTRPTYSGTNYAGGAPIQEPGSKGNEFRQSASYQSPYTAQPSGPATMAAEDGRPSQFYLWDLGIGIPSPGDPDYNDYQKYLRGRRSSTTV